MRPNYSVRMWETVMNLGLSVRHLAVGPRPIPWSMSKLIGAHSLWWDAMLSLDVGARDLVLAQLNVPVFVDIP